MSPHSTARSARIFYAVFGTATLAGFLFRIRMGMKDNLSTGANPVGPEMLSRLSGLAHSVVAVGDSALSHLLRVAIAPANLVVSTAAFVFRTAFAGIESAAPLFHLVQLYLLHGF